MRNVNEPVGVQAVGVDDFQSMHDFYRTHDDAEEGEKIIRAALDRGERRGPTDLDIFVHPEFPYSPRLPDQIGMEAFRAMESSRLLYRSVIERKMKDASSLIVLSYGVQHKSLFQPLYGNRKTLRTETNGMRTSGRLPLDEFARMTQMTDGLHPQDRLRVHGAEISQCIEDFLLQYAAALHFQQFQPALLQSDPEYSMSPQSRAEQSAEKDFHMLAQSTGLLRTKTRARLGHVFDCYDEFAVLSRDADYPVMQAVDEETVVYS